MKSEEIQVGKTYRGSDRERRTVIGTYGVGMRWRVHFRRVAGLTATCFADYFAAWAKEEVRDGE